MCSRVAASTARSVCGAVTRTEAWGQGQGDMCGDPAMQSTHFPSGPECPLNLDQKKT